MASRGLNKLFLIGRVGRDVELRYLPSGKAVASFSLAVGRVTGSGERRQEETEWFRVVAWDRLAETCSEFLRKGSRIFVVMWTKRVYCHLVALVKAHGRAPDRCWFSW